MIESFECFMMCETIVTFYGSYGLKFFGLMAWKDETVGPLPTFPINTCLDSRLLRHIAMTLID
jgi:hypothetical protein